MLIYFTIGLLWAWWLEFYTTSKLTGELGRPWVWKERLFHWFIWPWSLGTFIYAIITEYNKHK